MLSSIISASRGHSVSANGRNAPKPALLIRMSTGPVFVALFQTASAPPGAPRSAAIVSVVVAQLAATSSSCALRRAVSTSVAPRADSSRAIAAPMPLDPPVTSARRPARSLMAPWYSPAMRSVLLVVLACAACAASDAEVKTAKTAVYQADGAQILQLAEQGAMDENYKIATVDD